MIDHISFGAYPQSAVTDGALLARLNALYPFRDSGDSAWTSYRYYIEGKPCDYTWYRDVVLDDATYRGVYFTALRPSWTIDQADDHSEQARNGFEPNHVYWFRFEPILWRVIAREVGQTFLVSDCILDSRTFNDKYVPEPFLHNSGEGYANNYLLSDIRRWLNEVFLRTAFTTEEQARILPYEVDNSAASTNPYVEPDYFFHGQNPYASADTQDRVFLLSFREITNPYIGFAHDWLDSDPNRQHLVTDYARALGCFTYPTGKYQGLGNWLLRSPRANDPEDVRFVFASGVAEHYNCVYGTTYGIVPCITLPN